MSSLRVRVSIVAVFVSSCLAETTDTAVTSNVSQEVCDPKVSDCNPNPGGGGGFPCGFDPAPVVSSTAAGPCRVSGCAPISGQHGPQATPSPTVTCSAMGMGELLATADPRVAGLVHPAGVEQRDVGAYGFYQKQFVRRRGKRIARYFPIRVIQNERRTEDPA